MHAAAIADRIERYLRVPAVVGFEHPFVASLGDEFRARGLDVLDRPGLLVARGGGRGTVSAHIDRHGLVVRGGSLAYAATDAKAIRYGERRPPGAKARAAVCRRFEHETVYAYDPRTGEHLAEGKIRHDHICGLEEGLELDADGLDEVADGTPVAFTHRCRRDDAVLAGQLDNVASAALIGELFEAGYPGTALLTTEEEIGHSWEHLLRWFEEDGPVRDLVVLDTSPFDDEAPVTEGAVVMRHRDANGVFDAGLVADLGGRAREIGVPVVFKDDVLAAAGKPLGSTELGRLVSGTDGVITGATVQLATTDYHTNEERTSMRALHNVFTLLSRALL